MKHPPLLVTSQVDWCQVLRDDRVRLGLTCDALDDRIGWADRYTQKVEGGGTTPYGRSPIKMTRFGDYWLEGLGRAVVLIDRADAARLGELFPGDDKAVDRIRRTVIAYR